MTQDVSDDAAVNICLKMKLNFIIYLKQLQKYRQNNLIVRKLIKTI